MLRKLSDLGGGVNGHDANLRDKCGEEGGWGGAGGGAGGNEYVHIIMAHIIMCARNSAPRSEALCIMYRPPADPSEPDKVGVYVVYSVCRCSWFV